MKKLISLSLLMLIGLTTVSSLQADPETASPGVNRRERHQRKRIREGVRSGELTKEEAQGLREKERATRRKEREMKSDGKLTKEERQELHHDLNENSKEIYEEKHDAEKR